MKRDALKFRYIYGPIIETTPHTQPRTTELKLTNVTARVCTKSQETSAVNVYDLPVYVLDSILINFLNFKSEITFHFKLFA